MHRFTKGLYFRANYTFSKNIDNATNELFSSIVNPRRRSRCNNFPVSVVCPALDIRHKLAISWVYDFPNISTEHGYLKALAHGWELSGSYIAESGQPVTPLSDNDANANGDGAGDRTIINPNGIGLTGTTVTPLCNNGLAGGRRHVRRRPRAIRITLMTRTSAVIPLQGLGMLPPSVMSQTVQRRDSCRRVLVRKQTQAAIRLAHQV